MATVDTVDMVDTMAVDTDTTEARGPLMPNPRLKLMPLPNPKLMLNLGAMDIMAIPRDTVMVDTTVTAVPTVTDTDTVILARGPLMPKLNPRPNPGDTTAVDTDTDTADTDMVDTVDTIMVELLKTPLKLPSGSSHSNSFNLATIPSI